MKILVIGGTNIDINATSKEKLVERDSNIGIIDFSIGGVAKNICENLARLNLDVTFATILGSDYFGDEAYHYLSKLGIQILVKRVSKNTPTYLAVFDNSNDLLIGINDMDAINYLNNDFVDELIDFNNYNLVIIDSNLSKETLDYITKKCQAPIYAEAISVNKVMKLKPYLNRLEAIKCNRLEAEALVGHDIKDVNYILKELNKLGVNKVYLTDGANGSYLYEDNKISHLKALKMKIVNTTGAGDAFLSGVIYAQIKNLNKLKYGNALAKITLESKTSNNPDLTEKLLEKVVSEYEN